MNGLIKPPQKWWQKALKVLGFVVGAYLMYVLLFNLWFYLGKWNLERSWEQYQKNALNILRLDKYGGKTPRETYEAWVAALRKGDFELASKYVNPSSQESFLRGIEKRKKDGSLAQWLDQWPDWSKFHQVFDGTLARHDNTDEEQAFATTATASATTTVRVSDTLTLNFPPGPYRLDAEFWFNKEAGIWKIRQ